MPGIPASPPRGRPNTAARSESHPLTRYHTDRPKYGTGYYDRKSRRSGYAHLPATARESRRSFSIRRADGEQTRAVAPKVTTSEYEGRRLGKPRQRRRGGIEH